MPRNNGTGVIPSATVDRRQAPYEMIRDAIVQGRLEPGQALVETALAAWCGVSRTPIREALRRLEQDGLIHRDSRGMVVRQRSPGEIVDIYETRILLESAAGRLAADRRSQHDLRILKQWVERGRATDTSDIAGMVEINRAFHSAAWTATHNESLIDVLERLTLHLARYPGTTLTSPGRWKASNDEHAALVDAIERRDGEAAHNIALAHLETARDIRLASLEEGSRRH